MFMPIPRRDRSRPSVLVRGWRRTLVRRQAPLIEMAVATTVMAIALGLTPAVGVAQAALGLTPLTATHSVTVGVAAAPVPDAERRRRPLTFEEYLAAVLRSNPDYLAERPAIEIAAAERRAAGQLPDPELLTGFARDPAGEPGSYSLGVSQTILLGGKRRARIAVAEHGHAAARAELADFERSLLASAAEAYVDAAVAGQVYERQRQSVATLERLVAINLERVRTGDLGELDLLQSRVELRQLQNELLAADAEQQAALLQLAHLMGRHRSDTVYVPVALPEGSPGELRLDALIAGALEHRPDIVAARRGADAARAAVRLARAELVGDMDLSVSLQRPRLVPGSLTKNWGGAEFGVSLPVPFMSVANRGELRGAHHAADQAELYVRAAEARVESEVRQAFTRYELARARADQYSEELLADAEKVLAGRLYSYQRGNEPLIEVLLAQRAADEIYLAAYEGIGESLKALIALQEAAGIGQQLGGTSSRTGTK